ncbi:MAG TPA: dUTP diphosphatase [Dongiaceae bacterium]|nr:dUTP diphosphatase [Dongiaceae bacterium]
MQRQLTEMLTLQDRMNSKVHPQWREQGYAWYRAVWTECAELMDHYGWKWWKKQTPDLPQLQLEIVDIWHFGMSILLLQEADTAKLAARIADEWHSDDSNTDFRLAVEALAQHCLATHGFSVPLFHRLMTLADLSEEQLYKQYIGKNVLNFFRQDHGYKEGSYQRQWQGKDDNEHLAEVLAQLDANAPDFQQALYAALQARYPA